MNVRLLKAKRIEVGLKQVDLAKILGITEKTMNHKECSSVNKFRANEMLTLSQVLKLSLAEFNSIFLTTAYRLFNYFKVFLTIKGGEDYKKIRERGWSSRL